MTDHEIWKPIKGYELYYEVSNKGQIKALDRVALVLGTKHRPFFAFHKGRIMKPRLDKSRGYYYISLYKGGITKHIRIHTVVAQAFLGEKPFPSSHVRHLNCNPLDNRVENLAYGSSSENQIDSYKLDRGGAQKLLIRDVYDIREKLAMGMKQQEIADLYGITQSEVSYIKSGRAFGWLK